MKTPMIAAFLAVISIGSSGYADSRDGHRRYFSVGEFVAIDGVDTESLSEFLAESIPDYFSLLTIEKEVSQKYVNRRASLLNERLIYRATDSQRSNIKMDLDRILNWGDEDVQIFTTHAESNFGHAPKIAVVFQDSLFLISADFHELALGLHSPRQKLISLQAFLEDLPGSLDDLIERLREFYPPNCEDMLE